VINIKIERRGVKAGTGEVAPDQGPVRGGEDQDLAAGNGGEVEAGVEVTALEAGIGVEVLAETETETETEREWSLRLVSGLPQFPLLPRVYLLASLPALLPWAWCRPRPSVSSLHLPWASLPDLRLPDLRLRQL